ncbi:MAG: paraquat-inducible protein A [Gammaproteobacteria bacterium]|jgi:paraquat-inducible protein A
MSPIYYILSIALAGFLLISAVLVSDGEAALSRLQTPEEKTDTMVKGWMETLSLGLYSGASDKARERTKMEQIAGYHREHVNLASAGLASLSAAFIAMLVWLHRRTFAVQDRDQRQSTLRALILHVHGVAGLCLLVGLAAPMLTIIAQRDMAVLGTVVLQFETKSIIGTVRDLFAHGSVFVAGLLALFSIVVPVLKLILSMVALGTRSDRAHDACLRFLRAIGKWSMTDVFVVAILLAFLANKSNELTDAHLGPGLYFFAAYGLLSMTGSLLLAKTLPIDHLQVLTQAKALQQDNPPPSL